MSKNGERRSPRAFPLVGHAPSFLRDKLGFLRRARERFGDSVRLQIGEPVWLLNNPEDIEQILVASAYNFDKSRKLTSRRGRELSGSGLHTATGDDHLAKRRRVQPLFHRAVVRSHARSVIDSVEEMLAGWQPDSEIELFAEMMTLTQTVLLRTLLGRDLEDSNGRFTAAVNCRRRYIEYFFTSNLPRPEVWPFPIVWRYRSAVRLIHERLQEAIERRRRIADQKPDAGSRDMLSMLVAYRDRNGDGMTDREIRDEALTLISTGYETVGAALTWTWYLLSHHPEHQETMRRETEWMGEPASFDARRIEELSSTPKVFNEALRLFPPTWIFVRVAKEAITLPSGTSIAPGDKIYLCPYTMHRHEGYYPEPDRFDPGRFTAEAVNARPKFAFFPFGGGPRLCIGEPLARLEAMIVIGLLAQRFRFEPVQDHPVICRPTIVLEPLNGLPMRLRERS